VLFIVPDVPLSLDQIMDKMELARARHRESGIVDYSELEILLKTKLNKFEAFNASFGTVSTTGELLC